MLTKVVDQKGGYHQDWYIIAHKLNITSFISHRIHGTNGIFSYMNGWFVLYIKQVNISVFWIRHGKLGRSQYFWPTLRIIGSSNWRHFETLYPCVIQVRSPFHWIRRVTKKNQSQPMDPYEPPRISMECHKVFVSSLLKWVGEKTTSNWTISAHKVCWKVWMVCKHFTYLPNLHAFGVYEPCIFGILWLGRFFLGGNQSDLDFFVFLGESKLGEPGHSSRDLLIP